MRTAVTALLSLLVSAGLAQAMFVPPTEGPVPFRRDRVALDTDSMRSLSKAVFELGGGFKPYQPDQQRQLAQILALAVALDPANRAARDMIDHARADTSVDPEPARNNAAAKAAAELVAGAIEWLGDSQAGDDSNALSRCLQDVLPPKGENSPSHFGEWKDWVAELSAFEVERPAPVIASNSGGDTKPQPPPTAKTVPTPTPLAETTVLVPVRKGRTTPATLVPLHMSGTVGNADPGPFLHLGGDKNNRIADFDASLRAALQPRVGAFPAGLKIDLNLPEGHGYDFDANGKTISGAAAVLIDAALSGKAPDNVIVYAVVGIDGGLELPPHFWETLRNLPPRPADRIIVPRAAAEYLASMMVMDRADFFMSHEVLIAENVTQLCAYARGEGETAENFARFAEIQKAAEGKSLGTFLAIPATVSRLEAISSAMPNHASARLLALQGSGTRPRYLPRAILAQEMRTALNPLEYVRDNAMDRIQPGELDKVHDRVREALAALNRYTEPKDRDMDKEAVLAADTLRSLGRLLKTNDSRNSDIYTRRKDAYDAATRSFADIVSKLTQVAGDGADFRKAPVPKE